MSFRGLPSDSFQSNRVLFGALASCAVIGGAIIVWATRWRRYLPDAKELETILALRALSRVSDGTIYTVKWSDAAP